MRRIAFLFVLLLSSAAHAAAFKVIVNGSVRSESLPKKVVSDLFLKKAQKWPNGAPAVPVDQVESSASRDPFSRSVHGKPAAAIKSYWTQQIFAGREVPPVEKKTDDEVVAFVKSTPGAIGYVSDSANVDGVRVLTLE